MYIYRIAFPSLNEFMFSKWMSATFTPSTQTQKHLFQAASRSNYFACTCINGYVVFKHICLYVHIHKYVLHKCKHIPISSMCIFKSSVCCIGWLSSLTPGTSLPTPGSPLLTLSIIPFNILFFFRVILCCELKY